ncbi:MAG: IclR family transcriptional regulator [Thermodesulfobacteriota bacterium]
MHSRLPDKRATYTAPIVAKAMKIVEMIAKSSENPGISEIAIELDLAKSTTHGILAALEESGWVLRDPVTRKYSCGYALRYVSEQAQVRLSIVEQARPFLEGLASQLGEVVFLGICTGNRIMILDQVESPKDLKLTARPGTTIPILAGSVGKIFLAHKDRTWVTKFLQETKLPKFTSKSITDPETYLQQLDQAREAPVVVDLGEYMSNVWAAAVPIFYGKKNRRRLVAAFWVVGVDPNPASDKLERLATLAGRTGEALSKALSRQAVTS